MPSEDESLKRVCEALEALAASDAFELLAQARAEARARVRSMLSDALVESLLARLEEELAPAQQAQPVSAPTQRAQPVSAPAQQARPAPAPAPPPVAGPQEDQGEVSYVYGVIAAEGAGMLPELEGVTPGQSVAALAEGPVAAAISRVAAAEFDEVQLRERLGDMNWVERVARTHEHVLDEIRQRLTVIPMRMCTVYRTEDGVREMLRREESALQEALSHLGGKTEWGVKVFADRNQAKAALVEQEGSDSEVETTGAGAAYMQRRRRERDESEHVSQLIDRSASEIHERLKSVAADGLASPPQRPEVTGRAEEMALNGVYLVEDDQQETFHETVRALEGEFGPLGLELLETGPWPAYNFVPGTIGAAW